MPRKIRWSTYGICSEVAIRQAQVWAKVEDQDNIVEAMRLDTGDMPEQLSGMHVKEVYVGESDNNDDDSTVRVRRAGAPPRPTWNVLRYWLHWRVCRYCFSASVTCGNGDAAFYLRKPRMSVCQNACL